MNTTETMRAFTRVVEAGGFAAAAREMGVSRSVVSKYISQLENTLGTQLLIRSTRQVAPTETGLAFYERSVSILAELDDAIASVTDRQDRATGTLRINAPMSFGTMHLSVAVSEFMRQHPDVRIELVLNDRFVDPIEEGFDVSIRIAKPLYATSLISKAIGPVHRVLCASPGYIQQHGEPASPSQLSDHRCLHYGYQDSGSQWRLAGPDGEKTYAIHCAMWSNNGEILRDAALHDQGIALLPTFIVGEALQNGELRTVLNDFVASDISIFALYPRHRHLSSKVRLFVDMLDECVGAQPYWELTGESPAA